MAISDDPFTGFNFEVQFIIQNASGLGLTSPLCDAAFAECDGLEMTMEPKTIREGGNNTREIHLVGPVTYGKLTLKRGMTANLDLWKWFGLAAGNTARGTKAAGVLLMRDAAGIDQLRFKLTDCLPIKMKAPAFNAKEGIVAVEELQIAYSSFTVEAA